MITEKDGKLFARVDFEKGKRLNLTFNNTIVQKCDIDEQLTKLADTGEMEISNHGYTFRVERQDGKYNLSLTHPVTKRATLNENEKDRLEEMLKEVMDKCSGYSMTNSNSTTNLIQF
jgi:vesicle coat complex subunit